MVGKAVRLGKIKTEGKEWISISLMVTIQCSQIIERYDSKQ